MCHETIFHLCVPATEKILRTAVVYAALVIGLRLAGKRELAQLNSFDLVVLITISNAVQNAIIGPDNSLSGGLVGLATLLSVNSLVARIVYWFPRLGVLLQGRETVLFSNGAIANKNARHQLMTESELVTAARKQGAHSLRDVEEIALEPNGSIVVTLKEDVAMQRVIEEIRLLRRAVEARGTTP